MKIFNPNENNKIDKLRKENEELRNTLHNVLTKYENYEGLEAKVSQMKDKISELAKEELRIEEYLKSTASERAEKSKLIFELNREVGELKKKKSDLQTGNDVFQKKKEDKETET